jgi:hypothetical protein
MRTITADVPRTGVARALILDAADEGFIPRAVAEPYEEL